MPVPKATMATVEIAALDPTRSFSSAADQNEVANSEEIHANDSLLPLPITHEAKAFIAEVTSLYPASITLPAITENINPEKFQHHVHMVYTVDDFKEVFGRANEEECARLISQTQPGAGAFLQVVPLEPALRLSNNEFDYAVCRWLNIKGCTTASSIAHCACNANITPTELHLEGQCNCGPGRIERHDNMTREVRSMLQNAGCTVPPREPRAQVVGLGNGGGDIEVRGINKQGHIEVYDVQITHPQLPTNLQAGSARVPRAAITTVSALGGSDVGIPPSRRRQAPSTGGSAVGSVGA